MIKIIVSFEDDFKNYIEIQADSIKEAIEAWDEFGRETRLRNKKQNESKI